MVEPLKFSKTLISRLMPIIENGKGTMLQRFYQKNSNKMRRKKNGVDKTINKK